MTDTEIVSAFLDLREGLLRYLKRIAGNLIAEDLLQETYIRLLKSKDTFRNETSIKNWLYGIAGNLAIDHFRKMRRESKILSDIDVVNGDDIEKGGAFSDIVDGKPWNMPCESAIRKEMMECVAEFVNALQPGYKSVVLLKEMEGFSAVEIAEILSISRENVRVRLFRAREVLKAALSRNCSIYRNREGDIVCEKK